MKFSIDLFILFKIEGAFIVILKYSISLSFELNENFY